MLSLVCPPMCCVCLESLGQVYKLLWVCWCLQYPHVFEEDVLANIKQWVIEEPSKATAEGGAGKSVRSTGRKTDKDSDAIDREMLRTYATGLLAVALGGYERLLNSSLPHVI